MENYVTSSSSSSSSSSDDYADVITEQQLQALKSLIPSITDESDARTILEEAHDYLQRIHEETERLERELTISQEQQSETPTGSTRRDGNGSSQGLQLIRVETEKLREGRFVVKVEWRKGSRTAGDVQRVIESLEVTMTSILVGDVNRNPNHMITTAFVKVKKELRMTEEELYELIMARFRSQT